MTASRSPNLESPRRYRGLFWIDTDRIPEFAALLARRFGGGRPLSELRFRLRVFTAVHLSVDDAVILGVVPRGLGPRALGALATSLSRLKYPGRHEFTPHQLPAGLRCAPNGWNIVNLAAQESTAAGVQALAAARAIVRLADRFDVELHADVRAPNERVLKLYEAHGFVVADLREAKGSMHVVRPKRTSAINEGVGDRRADARARTRSHYEKYPFVEGGDRRISHWQRRLSAVLPPEMVRSRTVIDVGAGSGEVSLGLMQQGAQPIAIDLTRASTCRAADRGLRGQVCQADALALPLRSNSVDHAVSIGVLHHTPDWAAGLREMARVTRPGGRVVVMVYAPGTPYQFIWTAAGFLRKRFEVDALERIPTWLLAVMRRIVWLQVGQSLSDKQLRRLLADQLWTPTVHFVPRGKLNAVAHSLGLSKVKYVHLLWHAHLLAYQRTPR